MEILVDRKLILSKFLIPLNKFTDQAIINVDREYLDCVSYTTSDKQSIVLYTKLMIKNQITDPENLKSYTEEGYSFNESLSTANDWVFTR